MPTKSLLAFCGAIVVCASSFGATYVVPTDRAMARRTDAIVVGSALNSYVQTTDGGRIETVTRFSVEEVIKGAIVTSEIDVHEPGGFDGDRATWIPGAPRFRDGERVVVFLTRTPQKTWAITDLALGKFSFETDRAGQKLAVRDEGEIVGWDPDGSVHQEQRRAADRFLAFLRDEAHGRIGRTDYFVPYHPLRLQTRSETVGAPVINATFSPTSYTSAQGSGLGARWNAFPAAVAFYTGPGATAPAVSSVAGGVAAWDNDCGSNVNYVYAGTDPCSPSCHSSGLRSGTGFGPDGMNTVLFEQDLSWAGVPVFSCSTYSYGGTLGLGGPSAISASHVGPNGESFWTNVEADVEMNVGVLGCALFMSQNDLGSAVTHELGHTLGFRHSDQTRANNPGIACSTDPSLECASVAIMNSFVAHGLNGNLQSWDINAVRALYPGTVCGSVGGLRGDLTGDLKADIVWRRDVTGENYLWIMNGTTVTSTTPLTSVSDSAWTIVGSADFDGDGKSDLLWRNTTTGANYLWLMNGATVLSSMPVTSVADLNWKVAAIGDFNGDGRADIFWRNTSTGANYVWLMSGSTLLSSTPMPTVATSWSVAGTGDFDGDGKYDLLWRNTSTGDNYLWTLSGATITSSLPVTAASDLNWTVAAVGDFTGDGKADIFWRHNVSGANYLWIMSGATVASSAPVMSVADTNWTVVGFGDFNGDGKTDLFWQNVSSGATYVWLMNGASTLSLVAPPSVTDLNWKVVSPK